MEEKTENVKKINESSNNSDLLNIIQERNRENSIQGLLKPNKSEMSPEDKKEASSFMKKDSNL